MTSPTRFDETYQLASDLKVRIQYTGRDWVASLDTFADLLCKHGNTHRIPITCDRVMSQHDDPVMGHTFEWALRGARPAVTRLALLMLDEAMADMDFDICEEQA